MKTQSLLPAACALATLLGMPLSSGSAVSTPTIRALVAQVVPIAGALVLVLFVLALSATLLPPASRYLRCSWGSWR
jgi:hypothetical protein